MRPAFKTPIIIGNDGNFGALGETWLGSARNADSALYICVGTGIGSGLVQRGKLWRGDRESAGEIGHMIMQLGGPKCGCGGHGCFEALASRTAIERDLREAISGGRKSVLLELAGGDISVIRSGMIRKALDVEDELVTQVMRRAAEVLGYACVNVRHLIDPEAIVFGGGVIEACSDFIMPIIENIVGTRSFARRTRGGPRAALGLGRRRRGLGAVAAARKLVGRSPFKKRFQVKPTYPEISRLAAARLSSAGDTYGRDIYVSVGGKVKKRDEDAGREVVRLGRHGWAEGTGEGLPWWTGSVVRRTGKADKLKLTDEAYRYPGAAVDPMRSSADGQIGRSLQSLEVAQGGADPRDELAGPSCREEGRQPCATASQKQCPAEPGVARHCLFQAVAHVGERFECVTTP